MSIHKSVSRRSVGFLVLPQTRARVFRATRSPRKTYGDALVDEILAHCDDSIIWDTDTHGKPDLSALALQAVGDVDAEAVICISNQKLA